MNKMLTLAAVVSLAACGSKGAPPVAAVAASDDPFPADRILTYRVVVSSVTGGNDEPDPDEPDDDGTFDVICRQRTEVAAPWQISTIECDPDAGMFTARKDLEHMYVTDGTSWWARSGRVGQMDDASRWAGRKLTSSEIDDVLGQATKSLNAGPPPWMAVPPDAPCSDTSHSVSEEEEPDHASSSESSWCPLRGGGVRSGSVIWSSESGWHNGRSTVELVSVEPLR